MCKTLNPILLDLCLSYECNTVDTIKIRAFIIKKYIRDIPKINRPPVLDILLTSATDHALLSRTKTMIERISK